MICFDIGLTAKCGIALRVRYAHILNQKLGAPKADVKISIAKWPTANCTYTTPARPKPGRGLVSD
jgi:5-hydroxyisourate hydrolase-like protein (transthyretin family)